MYILIHDLDTIEASGVGEMDGAYPSANRDGASLLKWLE
jgi:hypothetical protein